MVYARSRIFNNFGRTSDQYIQFVTLRLTFVPLWGQAQIKTSA